MAVVAWRRVVDGTSFGGKVGEPLRFDEAWLIRVDSPLTGKQEIVKAVPVGWYSSHWENSDCKAMEFTLSPRNQDGMLWRLDVSFYPPPPPQKLDEETGRPKDFWERSGGVSTVPVFQDVNGLMITNAAGDPIEGLEKEREEATWTLTKFYDDETWIDDVANYAGSVNSEAWADGAPKTWKCYFKSAKLREIENVSRNRTASSEGEGDPVVGEEPDEQLKLVETVWEFRYEPETWKAMPWDVGFHEVVNGERKAILDSNGKAVKQPVALNANGTKRSVGAAPGVIRDGAGADLYPQIAFGTKFGDPQILPAS